LISTSEEETISFGKKYGESLDPGDIVGLFGNLGSGKTQFVKGVCNYFNVKDNVNSPTFIIVNEYKGQNANKNVRINHFDLYRIKNINELKEIGIESYIDNNSICLIEWAELADEYLKGHLKKIYFEYGEKDNERIIQWE
jgi:tRNA threonylcarbamoyladenosine biosynthesis protein TsaE